MKTDNKETILSNSEMPKTVFEMPILKLILVDTEEFCSMFKISSRTAYEWRRDKIIPFVKIQGHIFYRLSDVLSTLNELTIKNEKKTLN